MIESVRALAAGSCSHPEAMTRLGAPFRPCRFPSGFGLVVHARHGPILFDTGYAPAFARATDPFPERLYRALTPVRVRDDETARAQLARLGIAASDVRHVVVSHFHADHIAALGDFPRARIFASRAAWSSVRDRSRTGALLCGHLPALVPSDARDRLAFVDDAHPATLGEAYAPLGAAYDLLGDGSVLAVGLPGHAAGHIGLALPEAPRGPWLFVGDAAWSRAAIRDACPPPRITTAFLGDTRTYRATLRVLAEVARRNPSLRIVPAHDALHE